VKKYSPLTSQEWVLLVGLSLAVWSLLDRILPTWPAVLTTIAVFVATAIVWAIAKLWSATEYRFQFISSRNGEESSHDILDARDSIFVTHFSRNVPTEKYIQLLLRKIDEEVNVTRVVPAEIDREHADYEWLKQFQGKKYYSEMAIDSRNWPFDVMIFDESKVKVLFPSNLNVDHFKRGILFNNPQVASMFIVALQRAERKGAKVS
jgi:hypothetical protein